MTSLSRSLPTGITKFGAGGIFPGIPHCRHAGERGYRARVFDPRFLAVWIAISAVAVAAPLDAGKVLERWIESQARLESVEAAFVQTRELPALRVPLRSEGRVWMVRGGYFRWQIGDPAGVVVLRTPEGVWLAWPRRREFQKVDPSGAAGAEWLGALEFPGGLGAEEFHRRFEVVGETIDDAGICRVEMLPREVRARGAVKGMALKFVVESGAVLEFEIRLANGAVLRNEFLQPRVNQPVDMGIFRIETSGWREVGL